MTDTQVQSREQSEPEAIISDWRMGFRCPVNGRVVTVGPSDFAALVVRKGLKDHIHLLVRCLCGGTHSVEVE